MAGGAPQRPLRVWVDCTAAPHPLILRPLIERLAERGHEVSVTAREFGQTTGILDRLGIPYEAFGEHAGAGMAAKARTVAGRARALRRWAKPRRFDLALAHGSVDLAVVSAWLRVPAAQMQDYEFAGLQRQIAWRLARRVIVPDAIPPSRLRRAGAAQRKLVRYPGLKEDYYLADFTPDPAVIAETGAGALGVREDRAGDDRVLVVVRPPAETSAYHAGSPLFDQVLERLRAEPEVVTVLVPRTDEQRAAVRELTDPGLLMPERAIDAPSLIAYADLVVSAGGTMNREAVALGTPVYTLFAGRMGAVDERLIASGELRRLDDASAIVIEKRAERAGPRNPRDAEVWVEGALGAVG